MEKERTLSGLESQIVYAVDRLFLHFSKYDLANQTIDGLINLNKDVKEVLYPFQDSIFPTMVPGIMVAFPDLFQSYYTNPNIEKLVYRLETIKDKITGEIKERGFDITDF